jgi:hypothetical protein
VQIERSKKIVRYDWLTTPHRLRFSAEYISTTEKKIMPELAVLACFQCPAQARFGTATISNIQRHDEAKAR